MSPKTKEHSLEVRAKAVGMVEGGMTQRMVAESLAIPKRTIKDWMFKHKNGITLSNLPGRGRKSKLHRTAKIVIAKSVGKKRQSTRKLAKRLTSAGYKVSRETVRRHMKKQLDLTPYKPRVEPKLTDKQKKARLNFAKEHKDWTVEQWKMVMFTDESPYELFHPPNRQNDRIWASQASSIEPSPSVKHPESVMVWGGMTSQAVTELHIIPKKVMVTKEYYVTNILEGCLLPSLKRRKKNGSILKRQFCSPMSG